jgi:hypothetical protein
MQKRNASAALIPALALFLAAASAAPVLAQSTPAAGDTSQMTKDDVIAGTMDIDFKTRTQLDTSGDLKEGSAKLGAFDAYRFTFNVADTTEFNGEIQRTPKLYSKILGRPKQEAKLYYNVQLSVLNPRDLKQKKTVGKWVGTVPVDPATGAFDLSGGTAQDSALRVAVDAVGRAAAFTDNFGGKLNGKAETKENLGTSLYKRVVGNKTVEVKVTKSDPMRFEAVQLAKGPAEIYPKTTVNGRLDYDYETGNYYADNIKFTYNLDGKQIDDVMTGTIKWVEADDRKTSGKGHYEFNLRFNEEKNKPASGENAAFEKMSDEDAFFAVDNSVPTLTGRIDYVDTFIGGKDTPSASKVTYHLNANKLTKQQVVNFFKLWLIAVGPTNDE